MTRIAQISDVHFGSEDRAAVEEAVRVVNGEGVDAVYVCGDLTQRGKHAEFDAAQDWLSAFDAPLIVVPGNHDTPLLNLADRVARPFARFFDRHGAHFRPLTSGALRSAGLNTARGWQARSNWAEGSVRLDDLQEAIADADHDGLSALVCHHPFLSPPDAPMRTVTRRGARASEMLEASGASVLLTGHVHAPSATLWRTERGGYLAISAGTLSTRLRAAPPSFNMLTVSEGGLAAEVTVFERGSFSREPLGAWSFADFGAGQAAG